MQMCNVLYNSDSLNTRMKQNFLKSYALYTMFTIGILSCFIADFAYSLIFSVTLCGFSYPSELKRNTFGV